VPNPPNITNITPPRVAIIDERTGAVSREWYRFFYNLFYATGGLNQGAIPPGRGGTGTTQTPTDGTLLIGNGTTGVYNATQLGVGPGIASTTGPGSLSIENTGVLSNIAGDGISVDQATGDVTISNTGVLSIAAGRGIDVDQATGDVTVSTTAVLGPVTSTDMAIARYDGTTGDLIQDSSVILDDNSNIINPRSVQFSGAVPLGPPIGTLWFDAATDTLNLQQNAITQQIGEEIFIYGKATAAISGETILQAVYKTGTVGASGVITFAPTIAGITDPNLIIGIATEDIANNGFGRITNFGIVRGINTTGSTYGETWVDGQVIWYNPVTGGLTKTEPVAPNQKFQLGVVINAGSGGSGSFQVLLQPGSILGGTDSNVQFGTLANGDLIQYSTSLGYWTNVAASSIAIGTATNADNIKTVSTATNANYYLTFVDSNNGTAAYEAVYTDAGVTYNPSTNALTSGVSGGTF